MTLGTRLLPTYESVYPEDKKQALLTAGSDAYRSPVTIRTRLYDQLSGHPWPSPVNGHCLRNKLTADFHTDSPLEVWCYLGLSHCMYVSLCFWVGTRITGSSSPRLSPISGHCTIQTTARRHTASPLDVWGCLSCCPCLYVMVPPQTRLCISVNRQPWVRPASALGMVMSIPPLPSHESTWR